MSCLLLIQPKIGDMDTIRSMPHMPLGLLSTASFLKDEINIIFIDQRIDKNWKKSIADTILYQNPIAICLTTMSGSQIHYAIQISKYVKQRTDVPVIWGGIHPSIMPEQVLRCKYVDIVVRGEGEQTLFELITRIRDNKTILYVKGISLKENNSILHNHEREHFDLNKINNEPYNLVDINCYLPKFRGLSTLDFESSRGCSLKCLYCYNQNFRGSKYRYQKPEKVVQRLSELTNKFKINSFYIVDDNFMLNKKRSLKICELLLKNNQNIKWQLQGIDIKTVNNLSFKELQLIEKAGCNRFSIGADSGSNNILNYLNKRYSVTDIISANNKLKYFNITVYYSFLGGIPNENITDLEKSIQLALKITEDNPNARISPLYNYFPLPGTPMYKEIINTTNYTPPKELKDWEPVDYNNINVSYLDNKRKYLLSSAYLPTLLMDKKFHEYNTAFWLKFLTDLYRPVARMRLKNKFFSFMPENYLYKIWSGRI